MAKKPDTGMLTDLYGGLFHLTAIVQKRVKELVKGARPLVDVPRGRRKDHVDTALRELEDGKIEPTEGIAEPTVKDIFQAPMDEE